MADYKLGTRICLICMDGIQSLPGGTHGDVHATGDIVNISTVWDNGSGLSLIPGVDEFEIVEEGER